MLASAWPCEVEPWRGPKPPPGTPRLPVSAGRQAMARPACAPSGGGVETRGVRRPGQAAAPEADGIGVGTHVFLGARHQQAGEAKTEGAQSPADHLRAPRLAAVEIGETADELASERHAVVV